MALGIFVQCFNFRMDKIASVSGSVAPPRVTFACVSIAVQEYYELGPFVVVARVDNYCLMRRSEKTGEKRGS